MKTIDLFILEILIIFTSANNDRIFFDLSWDFFNINLDILIFLFISETPSSNSSIIGPLLLFIVISNPTFSPFLQPFIASCTS